MTTAEQKKHEEEYNQAKRRYENAYGDKARYERELINLQSRRTQIINEINSKKSDKKHLKSTYKTIEQSSGKNSDINAYLTKSNEKLASAALQFKGIGESSKGKQKDLEQLFSEKNTKSKNNIKKAFDEMKKAKGKLDTKIAELKKNIKDLEDEMDSNGTNQSRCKANIEAAKNAMNKASADMAYHKKHMQQ